MPNLEPWRRSPGAHRSAAGLLPSTKPPPHPTRQPCIDGRRCTRLLTVETRSHSLTLLTVQLFNLATRFKPHTPGTPHPRSEEHANRLTIPDGTSDPYGMDLKARSTVRPMDRAANTTGGCPHHQSQRTPTAILLPRCQRESFSGRRYVSRLDSMGPPFPLLPAVVRKLHRSHANVMLIVPWNNVAS